MIINTTILFVAACLASGVLTAVVRRAALRVGLTDVPDDHRKTHGKPTPLGGGIAVYLAVAGALGLSIVLPGAVQPVVWAHRAELFALLAAGGVIVLVGLIDDAVGLRGRQKLLGQILAASVLMGGGLTIQKVGVFGLSFELGWLSIPLTMFWLLGAINAVNLLDGIDGLATTVGLILVSAIAVMAALIDHPEVTVMAVLFAGGLLGFLGFNLPPARIFLGDAGSMLIGLVVGTLAIQGSLKGPGTVLLAAPLAVWTIPIFDVVAAIVRRKLTGRSIYTSDRAHLHHQLLARFGNGHKVLVWLAVSCVATSAAALVSVFLKNDLIALVACMAVVVVFIVTGLFGRAEFLLLISRLTKLGLSLMPYQAPRRPRFSQAAVRLQGTGQWNLLWETLTEAAERLSLSRIRLDVNLPAVGEGYNALWEQHPTTDAERCWRMELPLVMANQPVGRLTVYGERNGESACRDIERLLEMVEPFEVQFRDVARRRVLAHPHVGAPRFAECKEADTEALVPQGQAD